MDSSKPPSTALVKRSSDQLALMPPPPAPKRIKRPTVVLEEETYIDGLSHIIARDYFPGLVQTEAKQEFLEALDSKDDIWIQDAGKRLQEAMSGKTPGRRGVSFDTLPDQTPRGFIGDTPKTESKKEAPGPQVNLNLSLGAYQTKYTSEDNESFNTLLDKQNIKNREKHAYLWTGNKIPSARQIAYQERKAQRLTASETTNALTLMSQDTRPAMPNYKKAEPKNSFMFEPESMEDALQTRAQVSEGKSNAPLKSIVHANTRLSEDELPQQTVPASPSLSAINDAIRGHPRLNESSAGWETPRVQGYSFVDAEPTAAEMHAYDSGSIDPQAILTSLAKGVDSSYNPFNVKESDDREKLHHRLLDQKKTKGRVSELLGGNTPGKTPTPKFNSAPPKGGLTPAARMLYASIQKPSSISRDGNAQISNFDLTPRKTKKSNLMPGLTPKSDNSRLQE
jgi:protein DGCR14